MSNISPIFRLTLSTLKYSIISIYIFLCLSKFTFIPFIVAAIYLIAFYFYFLYSTGIPPKSISTFALLLISLVGDAPDFFSQHNGLSLS